MDGGGDNGGRSTRSQRVGEGKILSLRLSTAASAGGTSAERHRHRSNDGRGRRGRLDSGDRRRGGSVFGSRDNHNRGGDNRSGIVATGPHLVATSMQTGVAGIANGRQSSQEDKSGLAEELHDDECAERTVNVVLANEFSVVDEKDWTFQTCWCGMSVGLRNQFAIGIDQKRMTWSGTVREMKRKGTSTFSSLSSKQQRSKGKGRI